MQQNKIKFIRKQKGITLLKLSELTGISVGYLSHLENGSRKNPSLEVMNKISKALNESAAEVFFIHL